MDFDKLEIKIEADSSSATSSVDKLKTALDGLNTSLGSLNTSSLITMSDGVSKLASAMATLSPMMSGRGNDFATLGKRLSNLASNARPTDISALGSSLRTLSDGLTSVSNASTSTVAISSLAKSLSSLGYKSTDKAIANLPLLTTEISNMINTLSRLPAVNSNLTKLIAAMAALAKQGSKVGAVSRSLTTSSKSTNISLKSLYYRFFNISRIVGTVYANIWLLIRALRTLSSAIKSATSYGETLNYFEKAFDDIASRSTENWSDLGYENASDYYSSLSEKLKSEAKNISGQLSGVTSNGNGFQLYEGKNLGLNATDTLKAQTKFAQMSASMGVATENATLLSNVMTKLGGDIASLYDTDFDTVWGNLQSGLTGMSRTMDKYGVNVRNANLNQELMELGIDTTVDKLGQEDKVLLRTIVMLKGTTSAWGDLAETMYSNANQLRVLQANWQKLTTIIGSMFTSALTRILPIINAVLVALQKLATFVAGLFGINADFGSSIGSGLSDTEDYLDGIEDSADGASGAVKKLKNQLLGIDELNVINSQDDSGGAGGGAGGGSLGQLNEAFLEATDEYLKAWQKALDEMEDKIGNIADTIENSKAFQLLKDTFIAISEGDWETVGSNIVEMFTMGLDSMSEFLNSIDWEKVSENLSNFISGASEKLGGFSEALLKLGGTITKIVLQITLDEVSDHPLLTALLAGATTYSFTKDIELSVGVALVTFTIGAGFDVGKAIGEALFGNEDGAYDVSLGDLTVIFDDVSVTFEAYQNLKDEHPIAMWLFNGFVPIINLPLELSIAVKNIKKVSNFIADYIVRPIEDGWIKAVDKINPVNIIDKLAEIEEGVRTKVDGIVDFVDEYGFGGVLVLLAGFCVKFLDKLNLGLSTDKVKNNTIGISNGFTSAFAMAGANTTTGLASIAQKIKDYFSKSNTVSNWLIGISNGFKNTFNAVKTLVEGIINEIKTVINSVFGSKGNFDFSGFVSACRDACASVASMMSSALSQISNQTIEITVEEKEDTTKPKSTKKDTAEYIAKASGSKAGMPSNIKFANGGFPQSGSYFWAGENGVPELMGTVGGRTAVASGSEITGISDTIRSTSSQEVQLLRQQNELLMAIVNKPFGISDSEIFNSVRNSANNYTRTTGRLAF